MHVGACEVVAGIVQEAFLGAREFGKELFQFGPLVEETATVRQARIGREPTRHPGVRGRDLVERLQLGKVEILVGHLVADDDLALCEGWRRKAARQQQRDSKR
jgi:hypothetical protein